MTNALLLRGILSLFMLYSCNYSSEKPKNLLTEDKMANVIADFAIYGQATSDTENLNIVNSNYFVLQKHNISLKDIKENYKYYLLRPSSLDKIYDKAQKILISKDPEMKKYLDKKKSENTNP